MQFSSAFVRARELIFLSALKLLLKYCHPLFCQINPEDTPASVISLHLPRGQQLSVGPLPVGDGFSSEPQHAAILRTVMFFVLSLLSFSHV